jgi:6-phospho-beta-glucosidase
MIMQEALAALVGTTPGRLFMDYFGLNHLGFARKVLYRGTDILPALRQKLQMMAPERVLAVFGDEVMKDPKAQQELANTLRIFGETGILPSPYLQYYYFTREIIEHQRESGRTHAEYAMEIEKNLLAEYNRVTSGKKKLEKSRRGKWQADMMVGLLGAIANDSREIYIVNIPNRGALPELPDNKIVEVPAVVDAAGPRPWPWGQCL